MGLNVVELLAVLLPDGDVCQYHRIEAGGSAFRVMVMPPQGPEKEKLVTGAMGAALTVTENCAMLLGAFTDSSTTLMEWVPDAVHCIVALLLVEVKIEPPEPSDQRKVFWDTPFCT